MSPGANADDRCCAARSTTQHLCASDEELVSLADPALARSASQSGLAERLDAVLITCDARLVAATGPNCTFDPLT